MFCNWTIHYAPETVTFDAESGPESGARYRLVSDWDDDFTVITRQSSGYSALVEWCRAEDEGAVPEYFWDVLPDLTNAIVGATISTGTQGYQVDLAERVGLQTARELWVQENPGG